MQIKKRTISTFIEQNGIREFTPIDLNKKELFSSPHFYLAQNDINYVESNKTRINSSLSVLITLVAILIN